MNEREEKREGIERNNCESDEREGRKKNDQRINNENG